MRFTSTRGGGHTVEGVEGFLTRPLAPDGGLYVPVPESLTPLPESFLRRMSGLSYGQLGTHILGHFLSDTLNHAQIESLWFDTLARFRRDVVAPLVQLDSQLWVMELFHGPTCSFKDYALQLLGRLYGHFFPADGPRLTILGATSGDTGSAAIEGFRGHPAANIVILFPKDRISPLQRRQMTCVQAQNVHVLSIRGSFDDCQALVKQCFRDPRLGATYRLTAVNSINLVRILAQMVYYAYGASRLGGRVVFSVPSGNFGNALAGHYARRLGIPIHHIVLGSNQNDILTRALQHNDMSIQKLEPSLAPAMDIQVPSNFERLLATLPGMTPAECAHRMQHFAREGRLRFSTREFFQLRQWFSAYAYSDEVLPGALRDMYHRHGVILDPHSLIGVLAARAYIQEKGRALKGPVVALATAHPAKFPEVVTQALGKPPPCPDVMKDLDQKKEYFTELPNSKQELEAYMARHL